MIESVIGAGIVLYGMWELFVRPLQVRKEAIRRERDREESERKQREELKHREADQVYWRTIDAKAHQSYQAELVHRDETAAGKDFYFWIIDYRDAEDEPCCWWLEKRISVDGCWDSVLLGRYHTIPEAVAMGQALIDRHGYRHYYENHQLSLIVTTEEAQKRRLG